LAAAGAWLTSKPLGYAGASRPPDPRVIRLLAVGVTAGTFSALFGVGGGIVVVPLLILLAAFPEREAVATSLAAIVVTALAGVVVYALRGEVNVGYAALVGLPAMLGALIGASLQRRLSGSAIRLAFAALLVGVAIWLLLP
jgi:uncharacterized protein